MEYHKISYDGSEMQIIAVRNKFEAVGFYLLGNGMDYVGYNDLDMELLPADHKVEVECIGFPVYKTVEEMFNELKNKDLPALICNLIE